MLLACERPFFPAAPVPGFLASSVARAAPPFKVPLGPPLRAAFWTPALPFVLLPIHASQSPKQELYRRGASRAARGARPYLSRCFFKSSHCRAAQRRWLLGIPW